MIESRTGVMFEYTATPLPSFVEYSAYNSPLLEYPSSQIIRNPKVPRKLQNRTLMLSVGIPTDRSAMYFPPNIFESHAIQVIEEARSEGWLSVGINTALLSERDFAFSTPSTRILSDDTEKDIKRKLSSLTQNNGENHPLQEGEYYVVYNNRWVDKENVVGGNILFLSNPYKRESSADDEYVIEIQKGEWPRGISVHKSGFLQIIKSRYKFSPSVSYPTDYERLDPFLERAREKFLKFAQNTNLRASIGELMSILHAKRIAMNFEYYKGTLTPFDFND